MRFKSLFWLAGITLILGGCGITNGSSVNAQSNNFFHGKTITLIAPDKPGGGYDKWARLVAPYLGRQLDATVKVQNIPGAGTIVGTNDLTAAKPNGLTLGIIQGGGDMGNLVMGSTNQHFNLSKMTWLAEPTKSPTVIFGLNPGPYPTFQKVLSSNQSVLVLDTLNSQSDLANRVVLNAFHIPFHLITGYSSGKALQAGLLRGDGPIATATYSSWSPIIQAKKVTPLLVVTLNKQWAPHPKLLTLGAEMQHVSLTEQAQSALKILVPVVTLNHDFAGPPGIPSPRVQQLRAAFDAVLTNPKVIAQAKKEGLTIELTKGATLAKQLQQAQQHLNALKPFLNAPNS